jgi:hypothetical protein
MVDDCEGYHFLRCSVMQFYRFLQTLLTTVQKTITVMLKNV